MLGRKSYTQEELDRARSAIEGQLAAYANLAKAVAGEKGDGKARAALEGFEPLSFNNLTLALDRCFVHRVRAVAGKDGNPLNEVEIICESLMNNDGILCGSKVIKYVPDQAVLKLEVGDRIRLTAADFKRLSAAFFAELESKFL